MIPVSTLLGRSVVDEHGQAVAIITNVYIDRDKGRLLALVVRAVSFWPRKSSFIVAEDIANLAEETARVRPGYKLRSRQEIDLPRKWKLLGKSAVSATGVPLGWISDLDLDENGLQVVRFHIQLAPVKYLRSVLPKRILPWQRVVRITDNAAIFDVDPGIHLTQPVVNAVPTE